MISKELPQHDTSYAVYMSHTLLQSVIINTKADCYAELFSSAEPLHSLSAQAHVVHSAEFLCHLHKHAHTHENALRNIKTIFLYCASREAQTGRTL